MIAATASAVFRIDPNTNNVFFGRPGHGGEYLLGDGGNLRAARDRLREVLDLFAAFLEERPGFDVLTKMLYALDRHMGRVALALVGGSADRLHLLQRRLNDAWPTWRRAGEVVPVIEVSGRGEGFPFELLPLLDVEEITRIDNVSDAERIVRRFLGFGAIVRRSGNFPVTTADLEGIPQLPIQFLQAQTNGAATEFQQFGAHRGRVVLEGPWPAQRLPDDVLGERVKDALFDPRIGLDGALRAAPAQIQHFACHCRTGGALDSSNYALLLGPGGDQAVTLGDLEDHARKTFPATGQEDVARALVLVNACGSAQADIRSRASFAEFFVNNRHRGYIGTEIDIPDVVAAAFSERFYDALLEGTAVGEAVVRARERLFADWGNPLGMMYVLYGDPRIRVVANSSPEAAAPAAARRC